MDKIIIKGARENNLKNINIELPKNKLIVMTGVSGSGKSSLAFDTIFAEGQRRYVESLSAYARQFIGGTEKPDVDSIEGLSPSISIDQKSTNKNPRSTVGTITEIYDYLRLLFARIGVPYCPTHKIPIKSQSIEEMTNKIMEYDGKKISILSPIIHGEKGMHEEEIEDAKKSGYTKLRVNGNYVNVDDDFTLEKNKKDNIDIVIDKLTVASDERSRIFEDIEASCKMANGKVVFLIDEEEIVMSEKYACNKCNYSIPELEPRLFSFNSPYGACDECKGIGTKLKISEDLIMPDKDKTLNHGALLPINNDNNLYFSALKQVCKKYDIDMDTPVKNISREKLDIIFYGTKEKLDFKYESKTGNVRYVTDYYEGVVNLLQRRYIETSASWVRDWLSNYMVESTCEKCKGTRLKKEVLNVFINKKNIYDLTDMNLTKLKNFLESLKLNEEEKNISLLVLKEIINRLTFLENVGLNYLTLNRSAETLSGGEAQRIRLATQIGSKLSGVLYVLDEPSIGLHQRDNQRLIDSLKEMRDLGNTLIVVEHDEDTMRQCDFLVDIGPGAGENGGNVVAFGTPEEVMKNKNSLTGKYLSGELKIDVPKTRRKGNGKFLTIKGAKENNISLLVLKEIINRLTFLENVGLNYLTLNRSAETLSGGEAQRIRLATQIGSKLSGVLYVLDEPSIGLHQRDNQRLINSLKEMRDLGNTLIVVEHDEDTMRQCDFLVDIGPGAGENGGNVVAFGTPEEVMKNKNSLTGKYLSGELKIDVPKTRRKGNGKFLTIKGAKENNLRDIDVDFPLGKFVCVTGVSGSGKSTLVNEILYKTLQNYVYKSKVIPGKCNKVEGLSNIDKVVMITQDAIGRTPRSNPATYVGVFDDIRDLFTNTKEAKIKGYDKGKFSFNVKGGRCEACQGDGVKKIEMHFLPDVYVTCDVCHGKRYNKETLNVTYKGKNIADVLDMRVSEALEFFENVPKIYNKLKVLNDVGLSYIKLGQSAVELSGGEAGRVKLSKELQKKATGKSVFILDEPTTGLHTDDIKKLLEILNSIVDNGDTVIVIEHNLDVIKVADYIIDLGPEGGDGGGKIVCTGTPEEIVKNKNSYTGLYLKKYLK